MATVAVWPSPGTTVTLDDLTVIDSSGASVTYTAEVRGLLNTQALLQYDPLGGDVDPDPATGISTIYATTIAALSTIRGSADTQLASVECHTTRGDGGGGQFIWDSDDTSTANSGTILGSGDPGRWLRVYSGPINILWFGPVTAAKINAALTIQNALGGGTVTVPKSAMTITGLGSDRIKPLSNTRLVFDRGCTIATGVPTSNLSYPIYIGTVGASILDWEIEGNGLTITGDITTAYAQSGIFLGSITVGQDIKRGKISGVNCTNMRYDGISLGGNEGTTCTDVEISRCRFYENYRNGGAVTAMVGGITFTDCEFNGSNGGSVQSGFDIELDLGTTPFVCTDLRFVRCKFNDNAGQGFYGQTADRATQARVFLVDCEFNGNGAIGCIATIDGMRLDNCSAKGNTTDGFYVHHGAAATDCVASSNGAYGFRMFSGRGDTALMRCKSMYNVSGGMLLNSTVRSTSSMLVEACTVLGNRGSGIHLSYVSNARILRNHVVGNKRYGIRGSSAENCVIGGGNIVTGNGWETDNTYDGLILETAANQNSVTGNMVRQSGNFHTGTLQAASNTTTVMHLALSASKTDDEYIGMYARILSGTQNGAYGVITDYVGATQLATVYWDSGTAGALAGAPDDTSVVSIVGTRLFSGTAQSATSTTVVLADELAPSTDSVFAAGCIATIVSGTGSAAADRSRAVSSYTGSTRTLTVSPAWTTTPDSTSVIEIIAINRQRYGLVVDSGCYQNFVTPNDVANSGVTGSMLDSGTSTDTGSANYGHLSGSATYDPGNLVDGTGVTTTVTCTGAALGNFARASFSNALQGITVTAWVSSANTVSVRFQNESGGDLDLASGTLSVRVEK